MKPLTRAVLLISLFALLGSGAAPARQTSPERSEQNAKAEVIYLSHPWSGTVTYDYRPDGSDSQYSSVGRVVTTLHLKQAGKLAATGTLTQYGTWDETIDLKMTEQCWTNSHLSGSFSGGPAKVFSWDWKGNNTFYLAARVSPQVGLQVPLTRTGNTCDGTAPDESGSTFYWPMQIGHAEQWYHRAGRCAHTLAGVIHPGIRPDFPSNNTTVTYQLTQLPDQNSDGIPDGGTAQTGACATSTTPKPPPPPGACGSAVFNGCPPPNPYLPGAIDDYSLAGTCGKAHAGPDTGRPRCYILMGQKTIKAVKNHELNFLQLADANAGKIAQAMAEKAFRSQVRSQIITVAIKKFGSAGAAEAYTALGLGKTLASAISAVIFAANWHYLGLPGYPAKCFQFEMTYSGDKPKPAFDPIFSFIRTWDAQHPPTIGRGILTSTAHWYDQDKGHSYTMPMLCRGPNGQAVLTGAEPSSQLLDPPYVKFAIDFVH